MQLSAFFFKSTMCPLVSHLPSHGLEGGCVDKLSLGFQMKTSF